VQKTQPKTANIVDVLAVISNERHVLTHVV